MCENACKIIFSCNKHALLMTGEIGTIKYTRVGGSLNATDILGIAWIYLAMFWSNGGKSDSMLLLHQIRFGTTSLVENKAISFHFLFKTDLQKSCSDSFDCVPASAVAFCLSYQSLEYDSRHWKGSLPW